MWGIPLPVAGLQAVVSKKGLRPFKLGILLRRCTCNKHVENNHITAIFLLVPSFKWCICIFYIHCFTIFGLFLKMASILVGCVLILLHFVYRKPSTSHFVLVVIFSITLLLVATAKYTVNTWSCDGKNLKPQDRRQQMFFKTRWDSRFYSRPGQAPPGKFGDPVKPREIGAAVRIPWVVDGSMRATPNYWMRVDCLRHW